MQTDAQTAAWIELGMVPGLTPARFRDLLKVFGLPREILSCTPAQLGRVVPEALAVRIASRCHEQQVASALVWLAAESHYLVTLGDAAYPEMLLQCADPPPVLYVRGRADLLAKPSIAVVGSRNATPQGRQSARAMARNLSYAGIIVVSGLALGIDAAAHEGA